MVFKTITKRKIIKQMEKVFIRTRSTSNIVLALVILVVGLICVFISKSIALTIAGGCLVVLGIVLLFVKSLRRDKETGINYKFCNKYYPKSRKNEIINALKSNPASLDWAEKGHEESLRLDIYYNTENNTAFVRCYEFVPYEYIVCSEWLQLELDKSGNLVK